MSSSDLLGQRIKFQADADFNEDVVAGVVRRAPSIDFQTAEEAELRGMKDEDVLEITARENRLLVTHDRRTMPTHFARFVMRHASSGVIIIGQNVEVSIAIEELLLVWEASTPSEWVNRISSLPI